MNDTKKCPFCGGEILAVAKKCKHCGKWLNENTQTTTAPLSNSSKKEEVDHLESPIKPYAILLAGLGIIVSFSLLMHAIGVEDIKLKDKWDILLRIVLIIPDWLSYLVYAIVEFILLYGLLTGLKGHSKPMKTLLSIYIISYIASLIIALITGGDETIGEFLSFCICFVIQGIVGIRLLIHYRGELAKLGICMMCFAGLSLIDDAFLESESVILEIINFIISFFYFLLLLSLLSEEEEKEEEKKENA